MAKNYLDTDEIKELDLIVTMYLDYAELQAKNRRAMTMSDWNERLDAFLRFNERELLTHRGKVSAEVARSLAEERFAEFDASRRRNGVIDADRRDAESLSALERAVKNVDDEQ